MPMHTLFQVDVRTWSTHVAFYAHGVCTRACTHAVHLSAHLTMHTCPHTSIQLPMHMSVHISVLIYATTAALERISARHFRHRSMILAGGTCLPLGLALRFAIGTTQRFAANISYGRYSYGPSFNASLQTLVMADIVMAHHSTLRCKH